MNILELTQISISPELSLSSVVLKRTLVIPTGRTVLLRANVSLQERKCNFERCVSPNLIEENVGTNTGHHLLIGISHIGCGVTLNNTVRNMLDPEMLSTITNSYGRHEPNIIQ